MYCQSSLDYLLVLLSMFLLSFEWIISLLVLICCLGLVHFNNP